MTATATLPELVAPSRTAFDHWIADEVFDRLAQAPGRPAVLALDGEQVVETSAGDLARLVHGVAALMVERGVSDGDLVAIWAPNSARWLAVALAAARLGVVLAPLDAMAPAAEVGPQAVAIGAAMVFADAPDGGDGADGAALDAGEVPVIDLAAIAPGDNAPAGLPPQSDRPLALFRTSGTTGAPKTFTLTSRNIGTVVRALVDWGGVRAEDRVMLPLPLHHVYPLITAALPALTIGAALVLPESPTGGHIATAMKATRPTVLIGVPRLFETMLERIEARLAAAPWPARLFVGALSWLSRTLARLSGGRVGPGMMRLVAGKAAPGLRLLVSGGAHLKPETAAALKGMGWRVESGYGLSETASAFAGTFNGTRPGAVGKPLGPGEIRIADPNADGVGEICLRGPSVFSGYHDNPDANARAFDGDGFFRTGDLGRVDPDGYLYIVGRAKEVIVLAGGENVFPEDVEAAYLAHPFIQEIGVLEKNGALAALVLPDRAEIAATGTVEHDKAIRIALSSVAKSLPSTRRLSGFAIAREPLPRTRIGKLRRFLLPALYEAATGDRAAAPKAELSDADRAWLAEPPRAAVFRRLTAQASGAEPGLDSDLQMDLGFDSFAWMTLAVAIEEDTGVVLTLEDIAEIATVRDLMLRVTQKSADGAPARALAARLAEDRRWLAPRSGVERALGRLFYAVNSGLLRGLCGVDVEGRERLPETGPVLICPNHASMLDAPAIAAAMPGHLRARAAYAADKIVVFASRLFRLLCRPMRAFPVDQGVPTVAVELAVEALRGGSAVVWFPEGWQSPDGTLQRFEPGVGLVVAAAGVPVVPVLIEGSFEAWPRERAWPRPHRLRVVFGAPIPAETLLAGSEGEDAAGRAVRVATRLKAAIVQLGGRLENPAG